MAAILDDEVADVRRAYAELQRRLDEALVERDEAEAQKAAMAEILEVINASPGGLAPVFDAMLEKATVLCEASFGILMTYDGEIFQTVALRGVPAAYSEYLRKPIYPAPQNGLGRLLSGERLIHIQDIRADEAYRTGDPLRVATADLGGSRTHLVVPLLKDDTLLGAIVAYRQEVRPFTEKQIALLQSFAAQAVIAMENARLLGELRQRTGDLQELLEYQTATSDLLKVISRSTFDLQPVLDTLVETAARLCDAEMGHIVRRDGDVYRVAATFAFLPEWDAAVRRLTFEPGRGSIAGRTLLAREAVQIADLAADPEYALPEVISVGKMRTGLGVPLLREGEPIGVIYLARQRVEPFTERQIELVRTFADQAVIAIENGRLITETREALEQQTATAEVLGVINSSPGDLAPVFDAMLERATRLCEAALGVLSITDDGQYVRHVAFSGSPEVAEFLRSRLPVRPGPGTTLARLIEGENFVQVLDATTEQVYQRGDPGRRAMVDLAKARTIAGIALRKDGVLLGAITLYRQEVRPFSEKEIGLLQNFAAQAVIAMENARLITETREALEQQTATAEVLQVINSSPGDLAPVFNAMLERATTLCESAHGALFIREGESDHFHAIPSRGTPEVFAEFLTREPIYFDPERSILAQTLRQRSAIEIADMRLSEPYRYKFPLALAAVESGGTRTLLSVPLVRDDAPVGIFQLARQEVRPFSDKQIALVSNFAAQAVIAIENVRLITETREALEQQTATAEVLQVINSSPGDLAPVFDATLESATRLCEAAFGILWLCDRERFHAAALHGAPAAYAEVARVPNRPDPNNPLGRMLSGERLIVSNDVSDEEPYRAGDPVRRALVDLAGARSVIQVALVKDDVLLGSLTVYRQEVRPFSDKQISLLQNFAAQAVIAMENARLLGELRQRTDDLQESLEYQTATSDVLKVISRSTFDLQPVLDTLAETAARLCDAGYSAIFRRDGEVYRIAAVIAFSPETTDAARNFQTFLEQHPLVPGRGSMTGRVALERRAVHVADTASDPEYTLSEATTLGKLRTQLGVPLLREGEPVGVIVVARQRVEPFTERQVELVHTFADQAVIAMENSRLLGELRERTRDLQDSLEYQTATSDVLKVISRTDAKVETVLDTLVRTATHICAADQGVIHQLRDGLHCVAASFGTTQEYRDYVARNPIKPGRGTAIGRMALQRRVIHIEDALMDGEYTANEFQRLGRFRTMLAVPLFREDVVIGSILLTRSHVEPFTDNQIELVRTFADQAVIAIENSRLLTEQREALDRQTATAEVLQIINSSPGDLQPVFDAMLDKALELCEADFGVLWTYDGERIHATALRGVPPIFAEYLTRTPHFVGPDNAHGRLLRGEPVVHIADIAEDKAYSSGDPIRRTLVELGGGRTLVAVPLRKDDTFLGDFVIYRQEVRPFSDKQIALLQNFAAQAVIAIENARLLDEIRQRQAELRTTFDNMADGVAMFDEDLKLTAWNRNFQEILDVADAVLAQRPSYAEYLRILADRGEFGTEDIEAELSRRLDEMDQELRLERTRPDGRVIEVRRNAVPGGGFVLIYSDITERKRSEAEIHAARDAAEAAYRDLKSAQANLIQAEKMASLGQLTAGIAHEIKNPLNFVNNFAGLSVELLDELKETAAPAITALDDEKRAEIDETIVMLTGNLEKIAEHGRRADNIVKSMLEHSRGSSGERRSVDLNGLIEEALNLAYHGARAQDQTFNITLERDFAHGIAPIELVPQEITRVCLNLFGNGFYATTKRQKEGGDPKFKPTLKVSARDLGDGVEIAVRDNGIGVAPEIKEKLFQPFFTTKPTGEGTGLGLSISYDIVTQQHGGTITVDSRVGEFTEFTVRLPRSYRATVAEAAS